MGSLVPELLVQPPGTTICEVEMVMVPEPVTVKLKFADVKNPLAT